MTSRHTDRTSGARATPRWLLAALALAMLCAVLPSAPAVAQEFEADVYFESTGQTLGGPLYDAWLDAGGMDRFGEPVSPLVEVGGHWGQWFEYARLDVTAPDPAQATNADIATAPIGQMVANRLGFSRWHPAFQPDRGLLNLGVASIPKSHPLANGFLEMYRQPGMAERLGMPISREFSMNGATYQFFQGGALMWDEQNGVRFAPLGVVAAALHGDLRLAGERPEGVPSWSELTSLARYPGERWIDVNLSTYLLTAYEGSTPVLQTYVVDGSWEYPTVRGTFFIYSKLYAQTMRGVESDGTEWVTEDVPYVMYFYADYALHGAYWRSSFGYSGSHGCVNMPVDVAAWMYNWADYGTRVEVHD